MSSLTKDHLYNQSSLAGAAIPEEEEVSYTSSLMTVDKRPRHASEDNEINNVIFLGIILALIDIFVIPILAIILGSETLAMYRETDEYAVCPDNFSECICDTLNETCLMSEDGWYTAMRIYAIICCMIYEGGLLLVSCIVFLFIFMTRKGDIWMKQLFAMGLIGIRRYWKFNLLNEIVRFISFVWILIMVMTYKHIEQCFCKTENEEEIVADHSDTFHQRKDLHAECEILMIFLMIYLLSRRVMSCCLKQVNAYGVNRLWVEFYIKQEEETENDDDY